MWPAKSVEYKNQTIRVPIRNASPSGYTCSISIHESRWANPIHVTTDTLPFRDSSLAHAFDLASAMRWIDARAAP